ncbi:polysaccharide deacetylase family protein [Paenibacillus sp. TRM 82003]|uniref:polysaccharide deacetylase family protein n=1 Tax=Kineococcus sp. TRM81007 TaxID=2925831 RepID=UPI001F5A5939|nr:polysaccharide deacetylase family protein [Kineococcus sp. TRM81007]MCI2238269.1 polysaccharide deacetylase family protein [Kineococcus sp. TRM81007]MCI3924059.1 polysaccharide deacetylase family protein [Paenibacillus sp. TRM 82003]
MVSTATPAPTAGSPSRTSLGPGPDVLVRRRAADFDRPGRGRFTQPAWARPVNRALRGASTVLCADTDERVVALTYDDGPDPEQTPALLDVLARRSIRATFFVLVEHAEAHPGIVRRALDEGHEVELHGIDHTRLSALGTRAAVARVREGKDRLEQVTGRPVRFFRPPYGAQTLPQAVGFRALGLELVLWSGWAQDWVHDEVPAVAGRIVRPFRPGAVILLHDTRGDPDVGDPTEVPRFSRAEALSHALDLLSAGGAAEPWDYATVGQLLADRPAVRAVWAETSSRRRSR